MAADGRDFSVLRACNCMRTATALHRHRNRTLRYITQQLRDAASLHKFNWHTPRCSLPWMLVVLASVMCQLRYACQQPTAMPTRCRPRTSHHLAHADHSWRMRTRGALRPSRRCWSGELCTTHAGGPAQCLAQSCLQARASLRKSTL